MTQRVSRLLSGLISAIETTSDPRKADALRADYCAQLARSGRRQEAFDLLCGLRDKYRLHPHSQVAPWINVAAAAIDIVDGNNKEALLKMRRAHALAAAAEVVSLTPLTAASLAQMYWNRQEIESAVNYLREALRTALSDDHRARCRAALVMGEMLALSSREQASQHWFALARQCAAVVGDDASLSALAFNLSSVQLALLRQATFDASPTNGARGRAILQNEISRTLDLTLGIPHDYMTAFQYAQLLSLQQLPEQALSSYALQAASASLPTLIRRRGEWLSDEAWCHARLGSFDKARDCAAAAESALVPETQIDDLAATHSRLHLVYEAIGDVVQAARHEEIAAHSWREYRTFQSWCAGLVEGVTEQG